MLKKFDKTVLIVPMAIVVVLGLIISLLPEGSSTVIGAVRNFLGNDLGIYYLAFGLAAFGLLLYLAFSKIGKIRIGSAADKPMKTITWGILIFTSTMAADILFYAFHEWTYYYNASILNQTIEDAASKALWSSSYSLFHWGFIPWSFYLVLAVVYAFMFFNSHRRNKQKMSEACRPLFGKHTDGWVGKLINIVAVVGLLCGTATTFSVATPLMTGLVCQLFGIKTNLLITVLILVLITVIYTTAVIFGYKGITVIAKVTTCFFGFLLAFFFIVGGPRYILESGFQGLGNMLQNFFDMSTWTDPIRASTGAASGFPQDWTIFYWAYWIAWCVATPFFIAKISKGRSIKQIVLGGGLAGLLGTFASFIVFGGAGLHLQTNGTIDGAGMIAAGATPVEVIIKIIDSLPWSKFIMVVLFITMVGLYASTFDALTDVVSCFSYKTLDVDESPSKWVKIYWAVVFLILPIALLFLDTTNQLLQSVAIIGAFPLSFIMILIVISFFKDVKKTRCLYNDANGNRTVDSGENSLQDNPEQPTGDGVSAVADGVGDAGAGTDCAPDNATDTVNPKESK